jgi:F-type H+-transporting ATPase subunit b
MGPDWFTVIAQIINFLILVALLKRFLYGPIVRAMDRREEEISARLDTAARKIGEAEQERERYESLTREFSEAREEMRAKARDESEALRSELLEKAREEVERSRTQWRESFRGERESFLRSLRRHVCEEVCAVARKVVTEMADSSLEERMAACLERRIRGLGNEEREELAGYFRASSREIVVKSAFELSTEGRTALVRVLNSLTGAAALHFEVEPSLICGVEILAGGRSLAWNLEDYLGSLEEKLVEAVGKGAGEGLESPTEAGRYES